MPFKSKSQQRYMFAAEARGELPEGTARRWAHETKSIKKLPEKVKSSALGDLTTPHDSGKGLRDDQLHIGQRIEREHTNDAATARQIAIDHLREIPDYYTRLVRMEKKAFVDKVLRACS